MKTSTLLRKAKKYLPRDRRYPICYAIAEASYFCHDSDAAHEKSTDAIESRIHPFSMATHWLASKMVKERLGDWVHAQDPKAIQAWRHAWVDQLIVEFKAKGD